jgi:hypothetical protein
MPFGNMAEGWPPTHLFSASMRRTILGRLIQSARRDGLFRTVGRAAFRPAHLLMDLQVMRVLRFEAGVADSDDCCGMDSDQAAQDREFRQLTAEEVRRWSADPTLDLDAALARRIEADEDVCFGVFVGDRLAGYAWFALRPIDPRHSGNAALRIPADAAYMYKAYTHPDFRGHRLHGALIPRGLAGLASRGIRQLVMLVDWDNRPAIGSCLRIGCTHEGWLVSCRPAGVQRAWASAALRRKGIHINSRPAIVTRSVSEGVCCER